MRRVDALAGCLPLAMILLGVSGLLPESGESGIQVPINDPAFEGDGDAAALRADPWAGTTGDLLAAAWQRTCAGDFGGTPCHAVWTLLFADGAILRLEQSDRGGGNGPQCPELAQVANQSLSKAGVFGERPCEATFWPSRSLETQAGTLAGPVWQELQQRLLSTPPANYTLGWSDCCHASYHEALWLRGQGTAGVDFGAPARDEASGIPERASLALVAEAGRGVFRPEGFRSGTVVGTDALPNCAWDKPGSQMDWGGCR
jgi:hypothetical protein